MEKKFSKREWLELIDQHLADKTEDKYTPASRNQDEIKPPVTITFSTTVAFLAYYIAQKFADWQSGEGIYCSKKKIEETFNMSPKSVIKAFKLLELLGLLREDPSKKMTDGRQYYDLCMPTRFPEDRGVFPEGREGSSVGEEGVFPEGRQTTKRTTNVTNKETTKLAASDSEANLQGASLTALGSIPLDDLSNINNDIVDEDKESSGVFREGTPPNGLDNSSTTGEGSNQIISTSESIDGPNGVVEDMHDIDVFKLVAREENAKKTERELFLEAANKLLAKEYPQASGKDLEGYVWMLYKKAEHFDGSIDERIIKAAEKLGYIESQDSDDDIALDW